MASPIITPLVPGALNKLTLRQDESLETIALAIGIIIALSNTYTCLKYAYKTIRRQPRALPKMQLFIRSTLAGGLATPFMWQRYRISVLWQTSPTQYAMTSERATNSSVERLATKTTSVMLHTFESRNPDATGHLFLAVPMTYHDYTFGGDRADPYPLSYAEKIELAYKDLPDRIKLTCKVTLYMPQLNISGAGSRFSARILPIEGQAQVICDVMEHALASSSAARTDFVFNDCTCYIDPLAMSEILKDSTKNAHLHFIPANLNQHHTSQLATTVLFLDKIAQRRNPPVSQRVATLIEHMQESKRKSVHYYERHRPTAIDKKNFTQTKARSYFKDVMQETLQLS